MATLASGPLLLGLFLVVERRQVLVGERDQHVFLDLRELVDDLGLGPFFGEPGGQNGRALRRTAG